jgi:hypothetical protein
MYVYLSRSLNVHGFEFFVDGVVDPEVDVAPPEVLVLGQRNVGHGSLVRLANHLHIAFACGLWFNKNVFADKFGEKMAFFELKMLLVHEKN